VFSPKSERVRLPITIWILRNIIDFLLDRDAPGDLLLATLCSRLFFGLFRIGEILAKPPLEVWRMAFLGISSLSKTMLSSFICLAAMPMFFFFRDGVDVRVVCTGDKYCPKRLLTLLLLRQRPSSTDQPVFLWRGRQLSAGIFISDLGMRPSEYASHSFRKGRATTLATPYVPASFIKVIGLGSIAYQSYISVLIPSSSIPLLINPTFRFPIPSSSIPFVVLARSPILLLLLVVVLPILLISLALPISSTSMHSPIVFLLVVDYPQAVDELDRSRMVRVIGCFIHPFPDSPPRNLSSELLFPPIII
jgi:hypothetical protein